MMIKELYLTIYELDDSQIIIDAEILKSLFHALSLTSGKLKKIHISLHPEISLNTSENELDQIKQEFTSFLKK